MTDEKINENQPQDNKKNEKKCLCFCKNYCGKLIFLIIVVALIIAVNYLYHAKNDNLIQQENFTQLNPNFNSEREAKVEEIKKEIEKTPDDHNLYRELALQYYALGRFSDAVEALNTAIQMWPIDYLSYSILGDVYNDMGDLVVAEESYKKSIARNPAYYNVYIKLADFYKRNNRPDDVEKIYLDGIDKTKDTFIMKQYAIFLEKKGNLQGALDYWKLVLPQEESNATEIQSEIDRLTALIGQPAQSAPAQ